MIDKTFIDMLGYRYEARKTGTVFIVVGRADRRRMKVKFLDKNHLNFISGNYPRFGRGYAAYSVDFINRIGGFHKVPDDTYLNITDVIKTCLNLE